MLIIWMMKQLVHEAFVHKVQNAIYPCNKHACFPPEPKSWKEKKRQVLDYSNLNILNNLCLSQISNSNAKIIREWQISIPRSLPSFQEQIEASAGKVINKGLCCDLKHKYSLYTSELRQKSRFLSVRYLFVYTTLPQRTLTIIVPCPDIQEALTPFCPDVSVLDFLTKQQDCENFPSFLGTNGIHWHIQFNALHTGCATDNWVNGCNW